MKNEKFITGITGQDGAYSRVFWRYSVHGGLRRNSQDELYRLKVLDIHETNLVNLDISDQFQVFEVVRDNQFDEIYNLVAQSFVGSSRGISAYQQPTSTAWALYIYWKQLRDFPQILNFTKHQHLRCLKGS